jgi:hypothetical protein
LLSELFSVLLVSVEVFDSTGFSDSAPVLGFSADPLEDRFA